MFKSTSEFLSLNDKVLNRIMCYLIQKSNNDVMDTPKYQNKLDSSKGKKTNNNKKKLRSRKSIPRNHRKKPYKKYSLIGLALRKRDNKEGPDPYPHSTKKKRKTRIKVKSRYAD